MMHIILRWCQPAGPGSQYIVGEYSYSTSYT